LVFGFARDLEIAVMAISITTGISRRNLRRNQDHNGRLPPNGMSGPVILLPTGDTGFGNAKITGRQSNPGCNLRFPGTLERQNRNP
jgi:hypothetical protein